VFTRPLEARGKFVTKEKRGSSMVKGAAKKKRGREQEPACIENFDGRTQDGVYQGSKKKESGAGDVKKQEW